MQPGFWDILFVDVLVTARQRNNPVLYFMGVSDPLIHVVIETFQS